MSDVSKGKKNFVVVVPATAASLGAYTTGGLVRTYPRTHPGTYPHRIPTPHPHAAALRRRGAATYRQLSYAHLPPPTLPTS